MPDLRCRPATSADIPVIAHLLTETSRGKVFSYGELDQWKFIGLSSFWKYSLDYSYLGFCDGQPAGIILNTVDPETREAFANYWGVLDSVRRLGLGHLLLAQLLERLHHEGYAHLVSDTTEGSPHSWFSRHGFVREREQLELIASPRLADLPAPAPGFEIKPLIVEQVDDWRVPAPAHPHWLQRSRFLRASGRHLNAAGAFRNGRLAGYVIATLLGHVGTMVVDCRFTPEEPPRETAAILCRWLLERGYATPLRFAFLDPGTVEHEVLAALGFELTHPHYRISYDLARPFR